jgi:dolichol-phosphate mannosyltransferase
MSLSIIIPILNEKKNISLLVPKIISNLKNIKYEIIIVDDSSFDGSKEVLINLSKKNKKIKIIFRKEKIRDLSKSCKDGFELSKFDNILVMDGDLQHNPKYIPEMIKIFNKHNCDFVVGSRDLVNIRVKSLSVIRQLASYLLIKFFNILFGEKTVDPMSGFFLFKKKIYKKNKRLLFLKGFKILADLIYSNNNIYVKDKIIKFDYRKKGESKLNIKILLLLIQFIGFRLIQKLTGNL